MQFPNEKQSILMVTGKGGVGKSTVAAAMAKDLADQGLKTLLVELGEHSYYQYVYNKPIVYDPTEISPNFYISKWSGESALREYVYYLIKVKKIVDLFFDNKIMRTFIRAAPALKELAVLGKITSGIRQWGPDLNFDRIVVDGFSTGHFLALLQAPIGMADLIESGPMGEQSRRIRDVLERPDLCRYYIVTLPEELPVTETIEFRNDLKTRYGIGAEVICNRVYKTSLAINNIQNSFAEFLVNTIKSQTDQIAALSQQVPTFTQLPLVFSDDGKTVIDALSSDVKSALP